MSICDAGTSQNNAIHTLCITNDTTYNAMRHDFEQSPYRQKEKRSYKVKISNMLINKAINAKK